MTVSGLSKGYLAPLAILGLLASLSAAQAGAVTNGEWAREDGQVRVRLSSCGSKICAVNTWARDPQGQEKAGDKFVMSLVAKNADHWTGSAFDPQRQLVYTMDVSVTGGELTTRGCLSGSTLCQTAAWKRVAK